ncbi:MAG: hypothetical protein CSA20_07815 [Deltaproteobacteria bacterium]|nr:MAG: hypothetical protein CSA20_07815 [Deltaproteobacteria bacterium]
MRVIFQAGISVSEEFLADIRKSVVRNDTFFRFKKFYSCLLIYLLLPSETSSASVAAPGSLIFFRSRDGKYVAPAERCLMVKMGYSKAIGTERSVLKWSLSCAPYIFHLFKREKHGTIHTVGLWSCCSPYRCPDDRDRKGYKKNN